MIDKAHQATAQRDDHVAKTVLWAYSVLVFFDGNVNGQQARQTSNRLAYTYIGESEGKASG